MAKSKKKAPARSERLGASDWVRAGLVTLAQKGVANVRIERLARDLKVTKGSFYWHFKDRDALLDAMLAEWRVHSSLVNELAIERNPDDPWAQLRSLLRAPQTTSDASEGSQIELALRLWARRDDHVSALLGEMHRHRQKAMAQILQNCGVSATDLPSITELLSSVMLSLWITDGRSTASRDALIEQMTTIVRHYAKA